MLLRLTVGISYDKETKERLEKYLKAIEDARDKLDQYHNDLITDEEMDKKYEDLELPSAKDKDNLDVLLLNFKNVEIEPTYSYDENKCVKLSWNPDNLRIDETNDQISSYQYDNNNHINEIIFNINKKDSISYIFYKTDFNKIYDYKEFNLIESNQC